MDNLNFVTKDILQKEFKTKMRGYDPAEVDAFLDQVIKDYESYNNEIDRLDAENERLLGKVDELTRQLTVNKNNPSQPASAQSSSATNYDILKRLSNLERNVFGARLDDNGQHEPLTQTRQSQHGTYDQSPEEQGVKKLEPGDSIGIDGQESTYNPSDDNSQYY